MITKFEIYAAGHRDNGVTKSVWYALIIAHTDDGQKKEKTISGFVDGTRNQAEISGVLNALQCIKPEFRGGAKVVLNTPPGYVTQMCEKTYDGLWESVPASNQSLINAMREMINKYGNIEIKKAERDPEFRRCLSMVREVKYE